MQDRPVEVRPWRPWMSVLVFVPVLTDVIETGGLPNHPREWVTELALGLLIALLLRTIRRDNAALIALARVDGLTGLGNRRAFDEALLEECVRAKRSAKPLSLVFIDLDRFKQVNDQAGHQVGDLVLRQMANALRQAARAHFDRGFRLGGDEFALLLPGSTVEQAETVVSRIRLYCAQSDGLWRSGQLGLSAGLVQLDAQESPEELVRRGDMAMYQQKAAKRRATQPDTAGARAA